MQRSSESSIGREILIKEEDERLKRNKDRYSMSSTASQGEDGNPTNLFEDIEPFDSDYTKRYNYERLRAPWSDSEAMRDYPKRFVKEKTDAFKEESDKERALQTFGWDQGEYDKLPPPPKQPKPERKMWETKRLKWASKDRETEEDDDDDEQYGEDPLYRDASVHANIVRSRKSDFAKPLEGEEGFADNELVNDILADDSRDKDALKPYDPEEDSDPDIAAAARERRRQIQTQMKANADAGYSPDGRHQLNNQDYEVTSKGQFDKTNGAMRELDPRVDGLTDDFDSDIASAVNKPRFEYELLRMFREEEDTW
mmetsp:Transcript_15536/g.24859  ORF Transcript_15536/g.24859 Transcript_15536/m.24859 type:complete len:312 (-) Transcript_15536:167-1102(-)